MPKIKYIEKNFRKNSLILIDVAVDIINEYEAQGYSLTLRQLYYQFVARDIIENTQKSYNNLGSLINDARLAGLIDWYTIEDRTRSMKQNGHWSGVSDIMQTVVNSFALDKWETQPVYCEVWVEKDALIGVIERVCKKLDVPYFACRGYNSQSEQWRAGRRLRDKLQAGKEVTIFHLGDHDPSGLDMTRDNFDRLNMFAGGGVRVERLALNYDQVEEYSPPPNPTKLTDSRARDYVSEYGSSSWELDALEPAVISELIEVAVDGVRDDFEWQSMVEQEQEIINKLKDFSENEGE